MRCFILFILQSVFLNLTLDKKFVLLAHIQGAQDFLIVLAVKQGRLVSHQSSCKRVVKSMLMMRRSPVQAASLVMEGVEAHSWGVRLAVEEETLNSFSF